MLVEMVLAIENSRPSALSMISKNTAIAASILYLGLWAPAWGTIAASQSGDGAEPPWFVWIIIGSLFALFSSFAVVYFWYINAPQPKVSSELRYIALSLTAKVFSPGPPAVQRLPLTPRRSPCIGPSMSRF